MKEEVIEENVKLALQQIRIPKDVVEWTRNALLSASKTEQEDRTSRISLLNRRYEELNSKISKAYDHFLDGHVDHEVWDRKSNQWKQEKVEIQQQLDTLELDNNTFMNEGVRLLELASQAPSLFTYMTPDEKREIVSLVLSNPQIENGSLRYDYKKPFSMFVGITNLEKWRVRPKVMFPTT